MDTNRESKRQRTQTRFWLLVSSVFICVHLWFSVPVIAAAGKSEADPWAVEDPKEREKLPLYKTIPTATPSELTPHNGLPKHEVFETWTRSHGTDGCERFSALTQ